MVQHLAYTTERGFVTGLSLYSGHLPADAPTVVYLHGFKGFKDWGFTPYVAEQFVASGMRFLTLNFSHNGIGDDPMEFTELEKFRDNTFSLELEEALEIIGKYAAGRLFGVKSSGMMGLLGHSRGGGIALLAAHHAAIQAVCTWAAVSNFARYPAHIIEAWRQNGVLDVPNARTGQRMQLGFQIHEDLMAHYDGKLSIIGAVKSLQKPLCIIHGEADEAVSADDARAIFEWATQAQAELHLIPAAGHTFGAKHPFEQTHPHLEDAVAHSLEFFTSLLLA